MRLVTLTTAIAAFLLAGCSGGRTFIDGYPIGELARCDDGCLREIGFAADWLDRERPGHPEVTRIEIHLTDYRTREGGRILMTRSGGATSIAVIVFADGSLGAVQVGCGVGVDPTMCFTAPPSSFDL